MCNVLWTFSGSSLLGKCSINRALCPTQKQSKTPLTGVSLIPLGWKPNDTDATQQSPRKYVVNIGVIVDMTIVPCTQHKKVMKSSHHITEVIPLVMNANFPSTVKVHPDGCRDNPNRDRYANPDEGKQKLYHLRECDDRARGKYARVTYKSIRVYVW